MAEQLNSFQIQLLLYFPETDPKKRTVTDAAKCLGKTKVAITRALDKLEEKNIVERVEGRKTVLTSYGERLAQENAGEADDGTEIHAVSGSAAGSCTGECNDNASCRLYR